jgi:hypothetical protein
VKARLRVVILLFLLANPGGTAFAALPSQIDTLPQACAFLSEELARSTLLGEVRPLVSNEHIPTFYSQCEYTATRPGRQALRFVFKFMPKELFDVERLEPEMVDFSAGFAEGGLTHAEKLQFPGKLTYVFHDRDTTSVLMISGIDGPKDGAGEESTLVASYRLIDGDRSPKERRDILVKFPWKLLAALNKK